MKEKWLTRKETAERIGIDYRTLANWGTQKRGPAFVKLSEGRSGRVRYASRVIDAWLAERDSLRESA
ncbi:helix-turn-helix domain-containing protein [Streptomyces sp. NPDC006173]|uniref:helix-turn-helix transcriptional regulator n=1 Tax=Streptomyces sp. NPDC006173 TaxID=3155349 RepID=UPI0033FF940A